jgi:hypothetical protein
MREMVTFDPAGPFGFEARLKAAADSVDEAQMRQLIVGLTKSIMADAEPEDWPTVMLALAAVCASFVTDWAADPEIARAILGSAEAAQKPAVH